MNPRVIKEEGYKHLDRVIEICAKYKIYTVIDLARCTRWWVISRPIGLSRCEKTAYRQVRISTGTVIPAITKLIVRGFTLWMAAL